MSEKQSMKALMPTVARMVLERRAAWGAAHVDACIKAAMAGQPDQFYAVEGGHVAGTPFTLAGAMDTCHLALALGTAGMVMREPPKEK
jgi:hypothetical protein